MKGKSKALESAPESSSAARSTEEVQEEAPEEEALEEEEEDQESIRTCSATLRQLLRPDVAEDHYKDIADILQNKQTGITNTMDELSALALKMVLVVS